MIRQTTIITPATAALLAGLDMVKLELNITSTTDDVYLTRRILVNSSAIAAECGRSFGRETVRDVFRYTPNTPIGRNRLAPPLALSRNLLASVTSVSDATGVLLPARYDARLEAGLVFRVMLQEDPLVYPFDGLQGQARQWTTFPVTVDYVAGWLLPGQPGRDLPQVVEDVCVDMCVEDYFARGRDPGIRNESTDGVGVIRYTDAPYQDDRRLAPFWLRE